MSGLEGLRALCSVVAFVELGCVRAQGHVDCFRTSGLSCFAACCCTAPSMMSGSVLFLRAVLCTCCVMFVVEVPFSRKHGLGWSSDPPSQWSLRPSSLVGQFIILPWHSLPPSEGRVFFLFFSGQACVVMTSSLYFCAQLLPDWAF